MDILLVARPMTIVACSGVRRARSTSRRAIASRSASVTSWSAWATRLRRYAKAATRRASSGGTCDSDSSSASSAWTRACLRRRRRRGRACAGWWPARPEYRTNLVDPPAFGRRCIPPRGVARRLNIPDILPPRALQSGRLATLGASTGRWDRFPEIGSNGNRGDPSRRLARRLLPLQDPLGSAAGVPGREDRGQRPGDGETAPRGPAGRPRDHLAPGRQATAGGRQGPRRPAPAQGPGAGTLRGRHPAAHAQEQAVADILRAGRLAMAPACPTSGSVANAVASAVWTDARTGRIAPGRAVAAVLSSRHGALVAGTGDISYILFDTTPLGRISLCRFPRYGHPELCPLSPHGGIDALFQAHGHAPRACVPDLVADRSGSLCLRDRRRRAGLARLHYRPRRRQFRRRAARRLRRPSSTPRPTRTTTVMTNDNGVYTALYLIPGDLHA